MPSTFDTYFQNNPTLKLLRVNYAGSILGFFYDSFKKTRRTQIPEEDLEAFLNQHLDEIRTGEPEAMRRNSRHYLNQWCEDGYRYLQKRFSLANIRYIFHLFDKGVKGQPSKERGANHDKTEELGMNK